MLIGASQRKHNRTEHRLGSKAVVITHIDLHVTLNRKGNVVVKAVKEFFTIYELPLYGKLAM